MIHTRVGYSGGTSPNPTYRQMGDHSESLEIEFSPAAISYEDLVEIFWSSHNPQVHSYSRQYRAVLFTHNTAQARIARQYRDQLAEQANSRIFTEIVPAGIFYPAEDYHQNYYQTNPKRFNFYKWNCGRQKRLDALWGND